MYHCIWTRLRSKNLHLSVHVGWKKVNKLDRQFRVMLEQIVPTPEMAHSLSTRRGLI